MSRKWAPALSEQQFVFVGGVDEAKSDRTSKDINIISLPIDGIIRTNSNNNNSSSTTSNNKPSASSNEQQGRSKPVAVSPPTTTPTSPISFSSKSEPTDTKLSSTANNTTLADNTSNDFSETVHDEPVVDQGTVQGEQWVSSGGRGGVALCGDD